MTKFVDNLYQNQALIRRGAFNIPTAKENIFDREKLLRIYK